MMGSRHETLSAHPACEIQSYTEFGRITDIGIEEFIKVADNIIDSRRKTIRPQTSFSQRPTSYYKSNFDYKALG
jgi:hypothetical protein